MKKVIFATAVVVLFTACHSATEADVQVSSDSTIVIDSIKVDSVKVDSIK